MYSLGGFNSQSDSPVIVLSPHQHQFDPITRAAHSLYHTHDISKPNMADHRRSWDDQNRQRFKLSAFRPSEKKKRQAQEESGEIGVPIGPSIASATTPRASLESGMPDVQASNPVNTLNQAARSLEALVAGPSNNASVDQEERQTDSIEEESNHRRKTSRQSSEHSAASDRSRGFGFDFAMTPVTPLTPTTPLTNVTIDEWSTKISMSWITPKDDADSRSNNKILSHDWKSQDAQVRAINKNTHEALVEMPSGWYLFSDSMKLGRAIAVSKEQAILNLNAQPSVFTGESVQLPAHGELDAKTTPAQMLEMTMLNAVTRSPTGMQQTISLQMEENVHPQETNSNKAAANASDLNSMDLD